MQILIADDDPMALEVLRSALEENNYQVLTARNGREAFEMLKASICRLVISDWEMPEMDGIALCQAIRSGELCRYVYTILLTCREGKAHLVGGLTAGADEFMSKPFEPEELAVRLSTAQRILALETRELTIFALAKLAESRDPETGAHLERVRCYSRTLAQKLAARPKYAAQIDGEFIQLIYLTSPLHDIGKVAIPDHVLLKPGRLDDGEFAIMKTHAAAGAATLQSALNEYPDAKFLRMARDIAACHHERIDGNGYPDHLAGEQIPLAARIFSVADVYDALISKRVYKEAFTHSIARSIILKGAGTQFASDIIEAFLECEAEFQTISLLQSGQTPSPPSLPNPLATPNPLRAAG